jgi:predicted transposase/invertase (TIGR01784 family)
MEKLTNPHDKLFKTVFSRKEVAQEYISECFPALIVEKLNLDSLQLTNASFVDEKLDEFFADLIYRCQLTNGDETLIPLVLEHKSYVPAHAPLQILRYQLNGWEYQLKEKEPLTPIIPVIFYHGNETWQVRPWKDYLKGMCEEFEPFTPSGLYLLTDLSSMDDEQIKQFRSAFMKTVMLLMKHRQDRQFLLNHLGETLIFVEKFADWENDSVDLKIILLYLNSLPIINQGELSNQIRNLPKTKNLVMTIYETIEEKGLQKGMEKGMEKGMQLRAKIFIQGLLKKFPTMTDEEIAEIGSIPVESVKKIRLEIQKAAKVKKKDEKN